jgi:beta-adrenergic-receptor kinase
VDWEGIITDIVPPPFVPARDVNAASQSEIGNFAHSKDASDTVLTEEDDTIYKDWNWTSPKAFADEVMEVLIYERRTGVELVPLSVTSSCCCAIV